mmetsp:Transcript_173991/g.557808  ORF Transcript_173991/g.557808 Transcript_173991/m.557808 type:complete len:103 (-) Transcript_173991:129-437(-)
MAALARLTSVAAAVARPGIGRSALPRGGANTIVARRGSATKAVVEAAFEEIGGVAFAAACGGAVGGLIIGVEMLVGAGAGVEEARRPMRQPCPTPSLPPFSE